MKKMNWFVLCSWLMIALSARAQSVKDKELYLKEAGNFALLYQGILEKGYTRGYVNTPYYPQEYETGNLVYEGMKYTNVPMRLDCQTGKIVIKSPNGLHHIVLLPEIVPRVTIGNRDYVFFTAADKAPGNTYYIALYESMDWGIYKQQYISNVNQNLEQGKIRKEFSLKQRVFFKRGNRWQPLGDKDDFIKLFKMHKEKLKDYCKQEKLRPNVKREEDWIKLARYCETLMK